MNRVAPLMALLLAALPSAMAAAQGIEPSLDLTTDERRRGLSWSRGRPALVAGVVVPVGSTLSLGARGTTLRRSARHGGAALGFDLDAMIARDLGPWRLSGGVIGHVFTGRSELGYAEVEAGVGHLIGPLQIDLTATYAPRQRAIGGDNLYVRLAGSAALPGTPLALRAHLGHSSGDTRDIERAARLRPDGDYWDYRIGLDLTRTPVTFGVALSGTSADRPAPGRFVDRHVGTRLVAFARLAP
ncbi:TorF family putative porin [Sphingomonas jatrophae]|uniref:Outer membrane protein beta-barrel domain-containing protein n=1 Tax=Sphingomonas jatrophae TaxID=1166337 RepID=A0A1I6L0K1_9SPHN|nr:TorF family putative porin [Sphingomonas jatrophae]SFR96981.1 protein of unknown function (Gcw_chp) [Sphingomonas jatrophae]